MAIYKCDIRDRSPITGSRGLQIRGGGASEVLPLQKGEKVLAMLKEGYKEFLG